MQIDNLTLASLRDRVSENSREMKLLRKQYELANLLKTLELGLIDKEEVLNNKVYIEFLGKEYTRRLK